MLTVLLSALGLALPAGLNAWIPILVLALGDRFSSDVELADPYSFLSSTPGLIIILLLLPVELVLDKIPGIDHLSDIVHTLIRPAAGGIAAAALASSTDELNTAVAGVIGLGAAGIVHAAKMVIRPAITASTGGVGNPLASILEDAAAMVSSVCAIFIPLALLMVVPFVGGAVYLSWRRLGRGSSRLQRFSPEPR